ncbi:MAG: imidazole glycerol phosphate synthase subunit HisH [Clostridiales bacterium]|nr:imidazole glycerol phosphate synthase subunit HisH [Clostridiales bacterium]
MIGIIDYKAGNAPSVLNALHSLSIPSSLVSSSDDIEKSKGIILPGVGSAKATMESLKEMGCLETIEKKVLRDETPFLGICVGLQVLFEHSEEGDADCLGWLPGTVKRFPEDNVRVPQIGWNKARFIKNHTILSGLNTSEFFYFVNSYYVAPQNNIDILAMTEYGIEFCSMVARKNIFASQFHIEKSGATGLKLLRNFAHLAGGELCLQKD